VSRIVSLVEFEELEGRSNSHRLAAESVIRKIACGLSSLLTCFRAARLP
jgi:hypothetical protein